MMIHHVSVGSQDVVRAGQFYDAVLRIIGFPRINDFAPDAIGYGDDPQHAEFWVGQPHDGRSASVGNGTHVAFNAPDRAAVHRFYEQALAAGGESAGEPGPRPEYGPDFYGAFVRDLDGNKIEAVVRPVPIPATNLKPMQTKSRKAKKRAKAAPTKAPARAGKVVAKTGTRKVSVSARKTLKQQAKTVRRK